MCPGCTRAKGLVMVTVVKACGSTRVGLALCVGIFTVLAGCRKTPQLERALPAAKVTVQAAEAPQQIKQGGEDCGLSAYPVSKPNEQIVADASREGKWVPNSTMLAKVAVDTDGRVTHLKVLRLAYPQLSNSKSINEQAVDSIKRWHYAPTIFGGKPVAVCSDVTVLIDLRSN